MSKPCVRLTVNRGVAKDVGRRLRAFVEALIEVIEIRHRLMVSIVPGVVVCHGKSKTSGFGVFDSVNIRIFIAGIPLPRSEMTRAEWIRNAKHTIAHEFAHYEQFRDGRRLTERGVESRARKLVRMVESAS